MANLKTWAKALRLPFLTATAVPVTLGGVVAWQQGYPFQWGLFLLALLGVAFAHLGTNLANDYFDHKSGNDEANRTPTPFSGGSRVIQEGLISEKAVLLASSLFFIFGLAIMAILYSITQYNELLIIGTMGAFLGFFYTAPPFKLGYRGFGEVITGICFGPLVVLGSFEVQSGTLSLVPLIASLPVGILIGLVLLINEFPDYEADKAVRKNTAVVALGQRKALLIYHSFLFLSFGIVVIGAVMDILPYFSLLALFSFPLALKAFTASRLYASPSSHANVASNAMTIMLHLAFGALLIAGFIIDRMI